MLTPFALSQLLDDILAQLQLDTPHPEFGIKILAYLDLLDRWNRSYNLTAILDPYDRMIKHIADSLAVAPYLANPSLSPLILNQEQGGLKLKQRWLDVGSGAGLPGIPLALVFPNWQWTLLDSNSKKTRFLVQVKAVLGLENIEIVHASVESFRAQEGFDGVVSRAWTQLSEMVAKTQHLYRASSCLWAMKGIYPEEELAAISQPYQVYALKVPKLTEHRHLIRIQME